MTRSEQLEQVSNTLIIPDDLAIPKEYLRMVWRKGAQWADNNPDIGCLWVYVEAALPNVKDTEVSDWVLVYDGGEMRVARFVGHVPTYWQGVDGRPVPFAVTHWRHLPAPPPNHNHHIGKIKL